MHCKQTIDTTVFSVPVNVDVYFHCTPTGSCDCGFSLHLLLVPVVSV